MRPRSAAAVRGAALRRAADRAAGCGAGAAAPAAAHGHSEAVFVAQIILLLRLRPAARRGDAAHRPAGDHGPADGRRRCSGPSVLGALWPPPQRTRCSPAMPEQKAMIDAVSQLGILMLLLLDRHGDRSGAGAAHRQSRAQRFAGRYRGAVPVRHRAGRAAARQHAAAIPTSASSRRCSSARAGDLVGQDRRADDPRPRFPAPHDRPADRRGGDHRRHDRLDHPVDHLRARAAWRRSISPRSPAASSARCCFLPPASRSAAASVSLLIRWVERQFRQRPAGHHGDPGGHGGRWR